MSAVRDIDSGYKDLLKALRLDSLEVRVGVFAESGDENVLKAAVNEFGTADGRIPERSFLRSTVDKGQTRYAILLQEATKQVVLGRADWEAAFGQVGRIAVNDVRGTIIDMKPGNAASTIAKKGRDEPLVDTGEMAASIESRVVI